MVVELYRHGPTAGNLEYRYVGRTDEEVLPEWLENYKTEKDGATDFCGKFEENHEKEFLVVSPMKRCKQTAAVLFPGQKYKVIEALREKDFGDFEMKNYKDLEGNAYYQAWIDGGGMGAFPNGEDTRAFQKRCVTGFEEAVDQVMKSVEEGNWHDGVATLRFVVHGGTIMALMDVFSNPHKGYFDWKVKNGECLRCELNEIDWKKGKRELKVL